MYGATNPLPLHAFISHTWTTFPVLSGHLFCREQIQYNSIFSGLIWTASHPDMQKIRIIGFFFANRLYWQFLFRPLLFAVCKKSSPVTGLEWPRRFQEVKVPRFHDNGTGWW
jgi:hypothetical protein